MNGLIGQHSMGRREASRRFRFANPRRAMVTQAKTRARKRNIPFDMHWTDLPELPEKCPVLGIEIVWAFRGKGGWYDDSPSIDRIIPALGYVAGNVRIISNRANRLKADATLEEMELLLKDARNFGHRN